MRPFDQLRSVLNSFSLGSLMTTHQWSSPSSLSNDVANCSSRDTWDGPSIRWASSCCLNVSSRILRILFFRSFSYSPIAAGICDFVSILPSITPRLAPSSKALSSIVSRISTFHQVKRFHSPYIRKKRQGSKDSLTNLLLEPYMEELDDSNLQP